MKTLTWSLGMVLAITLALDAADASAQSLGTLRWQYSPYCNVVTLSVVQQGPVFVVSGFDDNCGNGNGSSVTGTAFVNPNGAIGMGLTTITVGGANLSTTVQVSPATGSGPWSDSQGHSGTFTFSPTVPASGSLRPGGATPTGMTTISQGTAVSLDAGRCYAIFAYGVGGPADAGRLITGFLRSSGGAAIVNNAFVMVPGTVNPTSQGGTLGYVLACNVSSGVQTLPAGWTLATKTFALP